MNFNSREIGNRFSKYLEDSNIKQNKLDRRANTSGTLIRNVLDGKNFTITTLDNIISALPELNPDWLLSGRGYMKAGEKKSGETVNFQGSSGNNFIGNRNKQKNISGAEAKANVAEANVTELQQELKECEKEKSELQRKVVDLQDKVIQILEKKI